VHVIKSLNETLIYIMSYNYSHKNTQIKVSGPGVEIRFDNGAMVASDRN